MFDYYWCCYRTVAVGIHGIVAAVDMFGFDHNFFGIRFPFADFAISAFANNDDVFDERSHDEDSS